MGARRGLRVAVGAVVLSLVVVAACSAEPDPPAQKVDRAALIRSIDAQVKVTTTQRNLRAVLVLKGGKTVFEKYYGTTADHYWGVEEITQVVMSTLIGIAIHEGRITGVDATLGDLLPDRKDDMTVDEAATTLAQLLTMSSGFPGTDHDKIWAYATRRDPVGAILRGADRPLFRAFEFPNHSAHLLAAVLAHATGTSVLDYARSRLFDPLGIDTRPAYERVTRPETLGPYTRADFAWPVDRSGLNLGWSMLKLRPDDLARIGQLYLDHGEWRGKQLVPASWIGRATSEQVLAQDIDSGYGYGWWIRDEAEPAYYAWGFGGQLLEVVPGLDLVVVAASEVDEDQPEAGTAASLTFLVDHVIIPAVTR